MYILIGRTQNYAWSLTSAGHDVRDVFAEKLCEPDGSQPDARLRPLRLQGQVQGVQDLRRRPARTASRSSTTVRCTVRCSPPPRSTASPTRSRASARPSAATASTSRALKDMTEGKATTPKKFWKTANKFGFTFNWAYASRKARRRTSPRASCRSAPRGLDRRLPTLGTGKYEWKGFLEPQRAPARRRRPERPAAELEQPVGAGLHARRRRAVRLRPARRAVRPVAAARRGSPTTSGS